MPSRGLAVTVVTGRPRPDTFEGRSSFSHLDTVFGSVEMITSSKPWMLIASWIAFIGDGSPTMASTRPPAASSSSGTASSSICSASLLP